MTHHPGNRFAGMPAKGVVSLLACSAPAFAHHSKAEYDDSTLVEARGEVVSVLWRNPHVRFQVSTQSIDGNPQLWEVEGEDLTRLDRAGLQRDLLEVGDVITFAGNPSTRSERRMYATHLVIENGREVLLIQPAVDVAAVIRDLLNEDGPEVLPVDTDPVPPPTATTAADGSFFAKVFVPTRPGQAPAWVQNPPLTAAARDGRAAYDEVPDDPVLGCVSPGMPRVMLRSGPYAIRFIERGADLVLQNEWFEIDRVIHMEGREPPADTPYTPLGYSAGRWEGEALVITTTHIDWPYFELYGLVGVPQSRAIRIVERFTPQDGGATLQYDFSATDPTAFTETVTYDRYVVFRWNPSLEFLPYDCIEEGRRARERPSSGER